MYLKKKSDRIKRKTKKMALPSDNSQKITPHHPVGFWDYAIVKFGEQIAPYPISVIPKDNFNAFYHVISATGVNPEQKQDDGNSHNKNIVAEFVALIFDEINESKNIPSSSVQRNSLSLYCGLGDKLTDLYLTSNRDGSVTFRGKKDEKRVSVDVLDNGFYAVFYKRNNNTFKFISSHEVKYISQIVDISGDIVA